MKNYNLFKSKNYLMRKQSNADKYLSIDPSGSGTTGCVFYDKQKKIYQFFNFASKN